MGMSSTPSDSYLAIEQRIRRRELSLSEQEHLLDRLVQQAQITSTQQQTLLELAWGMNTDPKPSP